MNKLPKDVERIWGSGTPVKVKPRPKKRKANKTKPMKPQIKSILIVIIGAILSALFISIMCFGIKLIIEGLLFCCFQKCSKN